MPFTNLTTPISQRAYKLIQNIAKGISTKATAAVLFIYILMHSFGLYAQKPNIKFKHLENLQGLSQNSVNSIIQDYMGFLWFGTNDGLNKFDGHNFTIYKYNPKQEGSILSNGITCLFEDSKNNLWVGTSKGICLYNREKNRFDRIMPHRPIYVNEIAEFGEGTICFKSLIDFVIYNPETGKDSSLYNNGEKLNYDLFTKGSVRLNKENYLITTKQGIFNFNTESLEISPKKIHNIADSRTINFNSAYKDSEGNLWLGTIGKGLFLAKNNDTSVVVIDVFSQSSNKDFGFNATNIEAFTEDLDKNLWIATENGVYVLNLLRFKVGHAKFHNYKHEPGNKYSLENSSIRDIFTDKSGTVWISTYGSGLSYNNKLLFKFQLIEYDNEASGINQNLVSYIYDEDEVLWIGTENGLNLFNKHLNTWEYFTYSPNNPESLGSNIIATIYRDKRNNIWVGTWAGGLNLLNENTGKFKRFTHSENNPGSISSNNVFSMLHDSKDRLWVPTMGGGLNIFNFETQTFQLYNPRGNSNAFTSKWMKGIAEDSKGQLWIGSGNGLNILNTDTDSVIQLFNEEGNLNSLAGNAIVCIFKDSKQNIWIGTEQGLSLYRESTNDFASFNQQSGLPNNVIKGIVDDLNGNLWVSTNEGLSCFLNAVNNIDSAHFINYGIDDGLLSNEFNSRSCMRDKKGILHFGGTNGLVSFHPDSIPINTEPPTIVLTDFLIFNKSANVGMPGSPLEKNAELCDSITISYKQSVITFKYAALNYIAPEQNTFFYMLEGFDETWNEVGGKTEATYTNLNPGEYTFRVKAANNDNVWNEKGIAITLIVQPPWWGTLWFRIMATLLVAGTILGVYVVRINELKKRQVYLEEQVEKRTEEINEKNKKLQQKTDDLNSANKKLEENQKRVLEQSEELKAQTQELSRKNADLSVLNSTKDKFFSIIAHDLKNPFSTVLGFSSLLVKKYDYYDNDKRKDILNIINESANNYYKLLENLLEWARTQTKSIEFKLEKVNLFQQVSEIRKLAESLLSEKKLELSINIEENFMVYADQNMLKTALRNIISNSIKFSEDGKILVSAHKVEGYCHISISDEGLGMHQQQAENLFKVDKSTSTEGTRGEKGTGLGLIITKEFIDYHEGQITVSSKLGYGTTFTIILPE